MFYQLYLYKLKNWSVVVTRMAAFQGMHVAPVKHSYAWLLRKCGYRTDTGKVYPYELLPFADDTIIWSFRGKSNLTEDKNFFYITINKVMKAEQDCLWYCPNNLCYFKLLMLKVHMSPGVALIVNCDYHLSVTTKKYDYRIERTDRNIPRKTKTYTRQNTGDMNLGKQPELDWIVQEKTVDSPIQVNLKATCFSIWY